LIYKKNKEKTALNKAITPDGQNLKEDSIKGLKKPG
jgi:hypothetical protein